MRSLTMIGLSLAMSVACDKGLPPREVPTETGDECVKVTWYADNDGDGHGVVSNTIVDCSNAALSGYTTDSYDDCNDNNPQVHPDLPEVCDGIDQDCDAQIDEDAITSVDWFADLDGDGFGDPDNVRPSCEQPPGYVEDNTDCNDYDEDVNTAATESCDGVDEDCDGTIDDRDTVPYYTYYADKDADGFGADDDTVVACELPKGMLEKGGDCDDIEPLINPAGTETCNGADDDCDGTIDDPDELTYTTYYYDADGDGYGDASSPVSSCGEVSGVVAIGSDCNDADPLIAPGAAEYCNGIDDDCDGTIDDPAEVYHYWYVDDDGDGYGVDGTGIYSCSVEPGRSLEDGDCDDRDPGVSPGAKDVCGDGLDVDCDGSDNCHPGHMSEPFVWTGTQGQWCYGDALLYYAYFGEITFDECQDIANATGTQWFAGFYSPYAQGWIGGQDATNANATSAGDWTNEVLTPRSSLRSCALAVFDHRTAPTVSPVTEYYTDADGRDWVYWRVDRQTHSQAIAFADDRGARILNPNEVGLTGLAKMTAPTHWCHAGAQFNGGSNCNSDNICDFIVGYWE